MASETPNVGFECALFINGREANLARDVNWKLTRQGVDRTNRGSKGWRIKKYGIGEWGCDFEMTCDATDQIFLDCRNALKNRSTVTVLSTGGSGGVGATAGVTGTAIVTQFDCPEPMEGLCTVKVTLEAASALTSVL